MTEGEIRNLRFIRTKEERMDPIAYAIGVPVLDQTFAVETLPDGRPASLGQVLLALTGQDEEDTVIIPFDRCREVDALVRRAFHVVRHMSEDLLIASNGDDGLYRHIDPTYALYPQQLVVSFASTARVRSPSFQYEGDLKKLTVSEVVRETEKDEYFAPSRCCSTRRHLSRTSPDEIESAAMAIRCLFDEAMREVSTIYFTARDVRGPYIAPMQFEFLGAINDDAPGAAMVLELMSFLLRILCPSGHEWVSTGGNPWRLSSYEQYPEQFIVVLEEKSSSATITLAQRALAGSRRRRAKELINAFLEKHQASQQLRTRFAISSAEVIGKEGIGKP